LKTIYFLYPEKTLQLTTTLALYVVNSKVVVLVHDRGIRSWKESILCVADLKAGLPDVSCSEIPKRGKYTEVPQNIPNGHKIVPMALK
jgi:hypothetical protein